MSGEYGYSTGMITTAPSMFPPSYGAYSASQSSLTLFHVPSDAANSLYVDGVPNDTS